jgi:hypothetical protein
MTFFLRTSVTQRLRSLSLRRRKNLKAKSPPVRLFSTQGESSLLEHLILQCERALPFVLVLHTGHLPGLAAQAIICPAH